MLTWMHETEKKYVQCFSEPKEDGRIIRFVDDKLSDMYCHNFSFIMDKLDDNELIKLINQEIEYRKSLGKDFLHIETNFDIATAVIEALPIRPDVTILDFMSISTSEYMKFPSCEVARVVKATTEAVLKDGAAADIESNAPGMGEFAYRRSARKTDVYADSNLPLYLYVCYCGDKPIGKCELFISDNIAKIEDFDILEAYQRKGFGTAVLKKLLQDAHDAGVQTAYLNTDAADTAKDMYKKCGFQKEGQKTQLLFKL